MKVALECGMLLHSRAAFYFCEKGSAPGFVNVQYKKWIWQYRAVKIDSITGNICSG